MPARPQTALAKPQVGLWEAIGNWLAVAGRLFIVRRRYTPPRRTTHAGTRIRPMPHTMLHPGAQQSLRERTELIQLQAENRRLRQQLARIKDREATAASPPAPTPPTTSNPAPPSPAPALHHEYARH